MLAINAVVMSPADLSGYDPEKAYTPQRNVFSAVGLVGSIRNTRHYLRAVKIDLSNLILAGMNLEMFSEADMPSSLL